MQNIKNILTAVFIFMVLFSLGNNYISSEKGTKATEMKIRMVLFIPADKSMPENYQQRYKEVADYTEAFFKKWMNYWNYPCSNPLNIERDEKGFPKMLVVNGKQNYDFEGYKKLNGIRKEVVETAREKYDIESEKQVWWILNYPRRQRGSRGGGNVENGGTCFANYVDSESAINIEDDLGVGVAEDILLKSLIHELGHAMGLGHIGPQFSLKLGNSLMGPINRAYKKVQPNDGRVYLSKAAAAILWKHPLFSGKYNNEFQMPSVKTEEIKVTYNKLKKQFEVKGKLVSNKKAHSVVILDASEGNKSPYWHRAFAGKVTTDGYFSCEISDLNESNGELIIGFCFENGAITGNGEKLGLNSSSLKIPYEFSNNKFSFEIE